ncbi:MAG: transporter [Myxococcota bacterium]
MPALAFLAFLAAVGDPPIGTDRPGNGNAATVVPDLRFQVETSANLLIDDGGDQVSLPTLLRFGLGDLVELRLGNGLFTLNLEGDEDPARDQVEATDTLLGMKIQLAQSEGLLPDVAVMMDLFLPTSPGNEDLLPEFRAATSWGLPASFALLVNLGFEVPTGVRPTPLGSSEQGPRERFVRLLYVVNLGYTIPALQERLTLFAEGFGLVSTDSELGVTTHRFSTGLALLLTDDVQLDSFVQIGLDSSASDFQAALGVSFRI